MPVGGALTKQFASTFHDNNITPILSYTAFVQVAKCALC